jgi:hypothetical protein
MSSDYGPVRLIVSTVAADVDADLLWEKNTVEWLANKLKWTVKQRQKKTKYKISQDLGVGACIQVELKGISDKLRPRSADWWLVLIYCERKILLTGWWLVAGTEMMWEKSTAGWLAASQPIEA